MASLHLTKSRTIAGLQCLRRLWLLVHEPPDYDEPGAGSPLAMGHEIGRHAHKLFPGGVLVAEEPWQHAQAVARTAALMADAAVPAVFEAAFVHDDIRIRVDVMERIPAGRGDGWGLREVKSSTRVKDHHLDDVALQRHVLAGAGVPVSSAEVLHVNNDYLRGTGGVEAHRAGGVTAQPAVQPGAAGTVWAPGHGVLAGVAFPRIRTFDSSATPPRPERTVAPSGLAAMDLSALRVELAGSNKN